ncbi:hypothetical protein ACFC8N_42715 [Streptomyces sp. NPDC055966]|uniref:hypothetical protein n=1 Tax=Streptomyces sp. NPDC055966 TaxID=3345669 RepID=UPI0035E1002E
MQQDRTARSALAPHPSDNVTQVAPSAQYDTEPLAAAAADAVARLERAFAPRTEKAVA